MKVRLGIVALALVLAAPAFAADFVGSETCRGCHLEAWEQWRESPHARAIASLSAEQKKDARCLACHARDAAQGGDPGVTCETCHGAGEYYSPSYVMRDAELARATGLQLPDAKSCQICHDASSPSLGKFDPVEKMKAIDHWTKARAGREKGRRTDAGPCDRLAPKARQAAATSATGETFLAAALKPGRPPARRER